MALTGWPSVTNDDGTYTVGTIFDAAFFASMEAALEAYIVSTTNPTVSPADIIDEVVDARGSKASLDARLDVSLNNDGSLKSIAGYATTAQHRSQLNRNLMADSLLLLWPDGDAAAPYNWALTGAGAAIARCGSGLADTTQLPYGDFCAKITYGSAEAKLTKTIISAAMIARLGGLKGKKIGIGCWCKASVASMASLIVDDGVTTTRCGETGEATYHDGDGANGFLYGVHEIDSAATKLDIYCSVNQAGSAYFGNFIITISDVAPSDWHPERVAFFTLGTQQRGDVAVVSDLNELRLPFPTPHGSMVYETKIKMKTAPTGAAYIIDVLNGGNSMYSTLPQVAAAATYGDARPDGTYAYRCLKEEDVATLDCTQIGSGTVGADSTILVTFYVPQSDLDLALI